jgi:hypothetical protein
MSLASPAEVQNRLEQVDAELGLRLNALEKAAFDWYRAKPQRDKLWAQTYIGFNGPAHLRKVAADGRVAEELEWAELEGLYEGLRAVVRGLETKASIGQSILRAQSRVGA